MRPLRAGAAVDAWVQAKRLKDFPTADRIRDELRAEGIEPDKARPAPVPPHVIDQRGNSRPPAPYNAFEQPGRPSGPPLGAMGSGNFRGGGGAKGPPGALPPQNDPQFLEHLDQLMNRQNQMEAQLIQMQQQLQSTNDILEQQAQLLAAAGLTPTSQVAQHSAVAPALEQAPSALAASELRTANGQAVTLAPPPSLDFGGPPLPMGAPPGLGEGLGGPMGGGMAGSGIAGAPPLPMGPPPGMGGYEYQ